MRDRAALKRRTIHAKATSQWHWQEMHKRALYGVRAHSTAFNMSSEAPGAVDPTCS